MTVSVAGLYRYPVKGLRGHQVPAIDVEPCGFAGDRRWMVVDPDRRFLTQRECTRMATVAVHPCQEGIVLSSDGLPGLPVPYPGTDTESIDVTVWRSTVPAVDAGNDAAAWLSDVLGRPCRLVFMADPAARPVDPAYGRESDRVSFADGFPMLLTSIGSLDDLNRRLAQAVPMIRFRPSLVVTGVEAWIEDGWRRIRIGSVVFRLPKPCARCSVPSVHQETGERPMPHEPLHTLGRFRRGDLGVIFGQNMIPEGPGRITVGDTVEVLETGPTPIFSLVAAGPDSGSTAGVAG